MGKIAKVWPLIAVLALACGSREVGPTPPSEDTATADDKPASTAKARETLPQPLPNDPLKVTIHRLSNGLTVYISPDPTEPRVSSWIAFRNGSRHDPAASTGLAHYLEHMLFKGSGKLGTSDIAKETPHLDRIAALYDKLRAAPASKRKAILADIDKANAASSKYSIPNELDQLYAELGISGVNAFTGEDMTVYIADVPSNRFEAWARVEGDRFVNPRFRLFYPELETVYEEKNRSLDNPGSQIYHALMKGLFPTHPYGTQPTIGLVEHLKTPAFGDMVRYYKKWYVPGNAAIVLAGDITAERALPVLEKYFASWPAKTIPSPDAATISPLEGRVEKTVTAAGENAVHLAWQTVPAGHPDEIALEVMDLLVDNSSTGLVNLELLLTQKLPKAGSSPDFLNEAGYWQLWGTAKAGQSHADVEKLLMGIVRKLKSGEFSQEDIDAIVTNAEIRAKLELESRGARVGKMAFAFIQGRPWQSVVDKLDRLKAVKKQDVVRVANAYLGNGVVVVKRVEGKPEIPKIDKPTITPISVKAGRRSAFAKEVAAMPAAEIEPRFLQAGRDYQLAKTDNGPMISAKNTANDLFQLTYVIDAGFEAWPLACISVDVAEASGVPGKSAAEVKRALYRLGTTLRIGCSRDRISISLAGLDRNMEASVALARELLGKPTFDGKLMRDIVGNELSKRSDRIKEPRFLARALADYAAHGRRADALLEPSNRKLKKLVPNAVRKTLATIVATRKTRLYFGPRSAAEAEAVSRLGGSQPNPKRRPLLFPRPHAGKVFVTATEVAQSNISIMHPVTRKLSEREKAMARLFTEYTGGGMGALIFQEIREARGLAYSATGYFQRAEYAGDDVAILGRLGTQSDKTLDALREMNKLLPVPPVRANRYQLALDSLRQRMRTSRVAPREVAETVLDFHDRGYKQDPAIKQWKTLQSVDLGAFESFVKSFAKVPRTMAMVTDPKRVKLQSLRRFGKVVELRPGKLVSYDD